MHSRYTLFSGKPKQTQRFLHREVEWFWMILVGHDACGFYMFFQFLLTPMPQISVIHVFWPSKLDGSWSQPAGHFSKLVLRIFRLWSPEKYTLNHGKTHAKPMQNPCFDVSYPVFYDLYLRYEMVLRSIGCFNRWLSRGIFQTPGRTENPFPVGKWWKLHVIAIWLYNVVYKRRETMLQAIVSVLSCHICYNIFMDILSVLLKGRVCIWLPTDWSVSDRPSVDMKIWSTNWIGTCLLQ